MLAVLKSNIMTGKIATAPQIRTRDRMEIKKCRKSVFLKLAGSADALWQSAADKERASI